MRGLHHREPGVVGALMYHQDTFAEVAKQSGITLRPEVFDILYRLKKDRLKFQQSLCPASFLPFVNVLPRWHVHAAHGHRVLHS